MMKLYKKILAALLYICAAILGCIILPNLPAIDNEIHKREADIITQDQIREVFVENAKEVEEGAEGTKSLPITGCFIQCNNRKIHNIYLQTDASLVTGTVNVYYILQADEAYSEMQCIQQKLYHWNDGYILCIDKAPYGIRIDLADYNGEGVHLLYACMNPKKMHICWENAVSWMLIPVTFLFLQKKRRYLFRDLWQYRKLLLQLSKNDLRARHAGMALGKIWAYIQPLLTILVMWYVFQVGFKNPPVRKIQFILWFMAGYIPWMYCSDAITGMTDAIGDYSYLVKKISFRISLLPAIRLLSALRVHMFFTAILFTSLLVYHHLPQLIWLQTVYYTFALSVFIFSVGLLLSALSVMLRDVSRMVTVVLQVLFWYTPVVWNCEEVSTSVLDVFRINPLFYIVQGYRETLIDHIWVWDKASQNIVFWSICAGCFLTAAVIFHRCQPHFADLL